MTPWGTGRGTSNVPGRGMTGARPMVVGAAGAVGTTPPDSRNQLVAAGVRVAAASWTSVPAAHADSEASAVSTRRPRRPPRVIRRPPLAAEGTVPLPRNLGTGRPGLHPSASVTPT